jgi:hypothetical protein
MGLPDKVNKMKAAESLFGFTPTHPPASQFLIKLRLIPKGSKSVRLKQET